jgi:uncharacterized membrane protein
MELTISIALIAIYLSGALVSYRRFEKIGISRDEESFAIILSMFSWLAVLALVTVKIIKKNKDEDS